MKFTDEDGKVWEFRGEYRIPRPGDYMLPDYQTAYGFRPKDGRVVKYNLWHYRGSGQGPVERAIVYPVHKRHTFGGVIFEETGETRCANAGEFTLNDDATVHLWAIDSDWDCLILRPVEIKPKGTGGGGGC